VTPTGLKPVRSKKKETLITLYQRLCGLVLRSAESLVGSKTPTGLKPVRSKKKETLITLYQRLCELVLRSAESLVGRKNAHQPETCEVKEERDTYDLVSKAAWVGAEVGKKPCWQ
jgi:hypothetical protein